MSTAATRRAALDGVKPRIPSITKRIADYLTAHPGSTFDDVVAGLGLRPNTCSARLSEMAQAGSIREAGIRRTRWGADAVAWEYVGGWSRQPAKRLSRLKQLEAENAELRRRLAGSETFNRPSEECA